MGAAVHSYIDPVATLNILIDFAGVVPICECFCRWAVVLLVSFLSVFCTLTHVHRLPIGECTHYSICTLPPKESIDNLSKNFLAVHNLDVDCYTELPYIICQ